MKEQNGQLPGSPILLTLKFDPSDLAWVDPQKLGIFREDPQRQGHWLYVGGKVNVDQAVIEASLMSYGKYAVLVYDHSFNDLTAHWSRQNVEVLVSRQIVNGIDNRRFMPDRAITRAELSKLLVELISKQPVQPEAGARISFPDVPSDAWYYDDVSLASQWGIVKGDGRGFRPDDSVTREELTVMVTRSLAILGKKAPADGVETLEPYTDAREVSIWAIEAMAWAIQEGLIKGYEDRQLQPKATATRAQAAVVIYRLLDAW